ncbi:DUF4765 family protein [Salmonella enterica]|nr:DUF4765 family protein [Salmonella enterica]
MPVSAEIAKEQVRSGRIVPEYTTDLSVADRFSREHYLIIVRVKVKYLTRGSVSESGWVMPKPYIIMLTPRSLRALRLPCSPNLVTAPSGVAFDAWPPVLE